MNNFGAWRNCEYFLGSLQKLSYIGRSFLYTFKIKVKNGNMFLGSLKFQIVLLDIPVISSKPYRCLVQAYVMRVHPHPWMRRMVWDSLYHKPLRQDLSHGGPIMIKEACRAFLILAMIHVIFQNFKTSLFDQKHAVCIFSLFFSPVCQQNRHWNQADRPVGVLQAPHTQFLTFVMLNKSISGSYFRFRSVAQFI